jgi:hypothetical protein
VAKNKDKKKSKKKDKDPANTNNPKLDGPDRPST